MRRFIFHRQKRPVFVSSTDGGQPKVDEVLKSIEKKILSSPARLPIEADETGLQSSCNSDVWKESSGDSLAQGEELCTIYGRIREDDGPVCHQITISERDLLSPSAVATLTKIFSKRVRKGDITLYIPDPDGDIELDSDNVGSLEDGSFLNIQY